ncbi:DNA-processing protein DprA [Streptomyces lichenis]|uniref:DNA-processing protein DprA n=1 Tax=Streptomyces lichenis TaxID=2306967 RepID=A0ABT0I5S6_9ACTN|nr:DNA-processing protein DprA [Streptomyces lichenis]MCK8676663.1 DNA-processing protein DprA [Streptomyces lichenis]
MRVVAITGTRSTGHRLSGDYNRLFSGYLAPFASDARFLVGGAVGIDTLALEWLAGHTEAALTVVTPGTVRQQPKRAHDAVKRLGERVELVELGATELCTATYHARNRYMVDRADMTIGFPSGEPDAASGTWYTLGYAARKGQPRLIVPV